MTGHLPSGVVGPDEGRTDWMGGLSVRLLVAAAETGGAFSVVEHRLLPRELAAPLHRHAREDELSLVTDGTIGFVLGEEVQTAGPGSLVRKPRDQWHTFYNAGDDEARLLEVITPAGFERYFAELVTLFPPDVPPDLPAVEAASERYGLTMDFASLPGLVERFGLVAPPELGAG